MFKEELHRLDKPEAETPTDLSVVVPLYNEEESVEVLLQRLDESLVRFGAANGQQDGSGDPTSLTFPIRRQCEIILVDDGSTDHTVEFAATAAASCRTPVRVVSLRRNFGQTAAMQAGIDFANGDLIATLDGDLQNDPDDIPGMVEHLQTHDLDLLVGRRVKRQDGMLLRLIPSWIANRLIAKVTGVRIHDYGCSLKIYRGSVIKKVRLQGEMHRFIPAWVASVTDPSRIGEIDVRHSSRQFGQSKYGISRTFRVLLDLVAVLFFLKFRARPGHFFGAIGMTVGAVGAVMLSIAFVSKYGFGEDIGSRPILLMGGFAMLSSIQLLGFGVMAEMLSRIQNDSGGQSTYVVHEVFDSTQHHTLRQPTLSFRPQPSADEQVSSPTLRRAG